jgi:hypothetical protein
MAAKGPGWHEHGVDADLFRELVYVPAADSFVAVFENRGEPEPRLYYRRTAAPRYRRIPSPGRSCFYNERVVAAFAAPFVFMNVLKWATAERQGANWGYVARFNLAEQRLDRMVDPQDLKFPTGAGGWISDLLGVSALGDMLLVRAGLWTPKDRDKPNRPMGYYVARLSLRTRRLTVISKLLNAFF